MAKEIIIRLPILHEGQTYILQNAKRFNVVRCGRRFGKTVLAQDLIIDIGLQKFPVAYFAPTYKMLNEVWKEVVNILNPITKRKDTQQKQLELITGAVVDFWSLDNPDGPRGRKYKRVIVDEGAMIEQLEDIWMKVLRPLLTDFQGDAWFLSTPVMGSDFEKLDKFSEKYNDWQSFHMSTSTNPHINKDELEQARLQLPKDVFDQEYLAEYVVFNGKMFIQYWDREKHIVTGVQHEQGLDTHLAWDFNITPTCLVIQNPEPDLIRVIKEYHIDLYDFDGLCRQIKLDFPNIFIVINGDASGKARDALTRDNESAYHKIRANFGLSWQQFSVPSSNPSHINSYMLCNTVFKNCRVEIDSTCEGLITDIENVKVQRRDNKFEIVKTDNKLTHHLDPLRYYISAHHQDKLTAYSLDEVD